MAAGIEAAAGRAVVGDGRKHGALSSRPEYAVGKGEPVITSKIFVGNLNYETTKEELEALLAEVGEIKDVYLPSDRVTGRPRGFAFVEFSSPEEAEEAIERFNDHELAGRKLRVNPAESRPRRAPSSGGYNFGPSYGEGGGRGGGKPSKPKGSRRGVRGKKRSL